jgi:hypothetical protein
MSPDSRSKYEFIQEASLSQQLASKNPNYCDYAGSDRRISDILAVLNTLDAFGMIDLKERNWQFVKALLNEQRKSAFATSDKVNEITKMGLQMPKAQGRFRDDNAGTGNEDSVH